MKWIITVGGGYGSFEFEGTEVEAEEMRKNKARSEGTSARKCKAEKEKCICPETLVSYATDSRSVCVRCGLPRR